VLLDRVPQAGFEPLQKTPGKTACFQNCPPAGPPVSVQHAPRCIRVACDLVGPRCPSASRVAAGGSGDGGSSGCVGCVRHVRYNSTWVPLGIDPSGSHITGPITQRSFLLGGWLGVRGGTARQVGSQSVIGTFGEHIPWAIFAKNDSSLANPFRGLGGGVRGRGGRPMTPPVSECLTLGLLDRSVPHVQDSSKLGI
jgi:hypothetical protein